MIFVRIKRNKNNFNEFLVFDAKITKKNRDFRHFGLKSIINKPNGIKKS